MYTAICSVQQTGWLPEILAHHGWVLLTLKRSNVQPLDKVYPAMICYICHMDYEMKVYTDFTQGHTMSMWHFSAVEDNYTVTRVEMMSIPYMPFLLEHRVVMQCLFSCPFISRFFDSVVLQYVASGLERRDLTKHSLLVRLCIHFIFTMVQHGTPIHNRLPLPWPVEVSHFFLSHRYAQPILRRLHRAP